MTSLVLNNRALILIFYQYLVCKSYNFILYLILTEWSIYYSRTVIAGILIYEFCLYYDLEQLLIFFLFQMNQKFVLKSPEMLLELAC